MKLLDTFTYAGSIAFPSLFIVAFLWRWPLLVALLLIVIAIPYFLSPTYLKLFVLAGFAGALAEALAVKFGAWSYGTPHFIGIPYWLPLVWGHAGIFLERLGRRIMKRTP